MVDDVIQKYLKWHHTNVFEMTSMSYKRIWNTSYKRICDDVITAYLKRRHTNVYLTWFHTCIYKRLCVVISQGSQPPPSSGSSSSSAAAASMLSRAQDYVTDVGGKLSLDCEFHMDNFNMFDNPIVWAKHQRSEHTKINIMGVIQEPFATTRRYDVALVAQPPRYRLRLKIKGSCRMYIIIFD